MKTTGTAYLLALAGLATPFAGIHRFYLGRPLSGLLYLLTWGCLGLGTVIDLFLIPRMVDDENRRLLFPGSPTRLAMLRATNQAPSDMSPGSPSNPALRTSELSLASGDKLGRDAASPEQQILRIASEQKGVVTVAMVSLHSGMSLRKAKKELERLREEGFCSVDVSTEGVKLYVFDGLLENERIKID